MDEECEILSLHYTMEGALKYAEKLMTTDLGVHSSCKNWEEKCKLTASGWENQSSNDELTIFHFLGKRNYLFINRKTIKS